MDANTPSQNNPVQVNTPAPPATASNVANPPKAHSLGILHKFFLLVAILMVIVVGIEVGALLYSKNFNTQPEAKSDKTQPSSAKVFTLSVSSPTEEAVVVDGTLTVKGKTSPDTTVVVYSDSDQASVVSDSIGNFEARVKVDPGINTVNVSAFNDNGDEKSVSLDVVYDQT